MTGSAWLLRSSSPPEPSASAGRTSASRRSASSSSWLDSSTVRTVAGARHTARRLRLGLLSAVLCLPLLAGLSAPTAAQTPQQASGGATVSVSSLTIPNKQSADYRVKLTKAPSGSVVISLTSGAPATATVSPSTLTFTSGDWDGDKTVTVTGRGVGTTSISHAVQSSADTTNYPTTTPLPGVAVTVGAAEPLGAAPRVQLIPVFGGRTLPEGLAGVGMNFSLTRHLATDETVTLPLSAGGTATRGTDYRLSCRAGGAITCNNLDGASPSITIHGARMSCNHSASKCRRVGSGLFIDVIEDNTVESDETVTLSFESFKPLTLTLKDTPSSVQVSFTTPDGFFIRFRYDRIDPVLELAARANRPFLWGGARFRRGFLKQQRQVLDEGRDCGIAAGLVIPLHDAGGRRTWAVHGGCRRDRPPPGCRAGRTRAPCRSRADRLLPRCARRAASAWFCAENAKLWQLKGVPVAVSLPRRAPSLPISRRAAT